MHSSSLNEDLISYSKAKRQSTFGRIYPPLIYLFKWLVAKQYQTITNADYKDLEQLALIRIINNIHRYNPDKGMTAVSYVRMLLSQELSLQRNKIEKDKSRCIEYNQQKDSRSIECGNNGIRLEDYRLQLSKYMLTAPLTHRKVIRVLINTLGKKELNDMKYMDRLRYYSIKANKPVHIVSEVIRTIRKAQLMNGV